MKKKFWGTSAVALVFILISAVALAAQLSPIQQLGEQLYFDKKLSINQNQACATCHHPSAAFADPLNRKFPYDFPVSLGSDTNLNGGRNAPTASYAAFSPVFHFDGELYIGGQFWDGRVDTLADQAEGPFRNPVEMAMPDKAAVIAAIAKQQKKYQKLFLQVWGIDISMIDTTMGDTAEVEDAYRKMALSIGEFEKTNAFRPFTSKYDYYLAGLEGLNAQELSGLALFEGKAQCNLCHPNAATILADGTIEPPLFTDFSYDNLGVPENQNPLIVNNRPDYGLGENAQVLADALANSDPVFQAVDDSGSLVYDADGLPVMVAENEAGKVKVSSLRNIARTPPYTHNGFFATLEEIVHFYNIAATWPDPPEVALNVNRDELGALGLTPQEEADLVAFLNTLTDRENKKTPKNFTLPVITSMPAN